MKPTLLAVIREAECIGCTQCISACPVDAIVGTNKHMHTVIANECIGCELCIAPCPVDCIELIPREPLTDTIENAKTHLAKDRIRARKIRLQKEESILESFNDKSMTEKKALLQTILSRVKKQ